jgi:hypothetical protein
MDLKARVDRLLKTRKTIVGQPRWTVGQRPDMREIRRILLEDGEALGGNLITQAYPGTATREFRHLITFLPHGAARPQARCVARLDNAPDTDGPHMNDFGGTPGYPACYVDDVHYHDWEGNRHLAKANDLPQKLLYARNIGSRINNIGDGFWWFCQQNHIDATKLDVPEWPSLGQLL